MAYEVGGKTMEPNANGYLVDVNDWNEEIAQIIAKEEGIELTDKHWDLINYLRDEFINNAGNQTNNRNIVKPMSDKWGEKLGQKDVYALFPRDPSKQGGRIGGLPESRRKGGY